MHTNTNTYTYLLSEILELICNIFIYQNRERSIFIKPLYKKVFRIEFLESQYPIILYFDKKKIYIFNNWNNQLHYVIRINFKTFLSLLKNHSIEEAIEESIKDRFLEINGNIKLKHDLIKFLNGMQLNYINFLFPYLNDALIEMLNNIVKNYWVFIIKKIDITQKFLNIAITDEWKLIPNLLELSWFYKNIYNLQTKEKSLSKRVNKLKEI